MYLVPNIHPGSGSAGVPTVQANFAALLSDWTTLDTVSSMPSGGSITRSGQAMLYDSTGKLTYAPNNVLTYSEQFDNASWNKLNSTVTADATTAPDGTSTADKLVETTATGTHSLYRTMADTYIISVYAKAAERTIISIGNGTDAQYAVFNLSAGTVTSAGSGTISSGSITSVGSGWYRCSCKFTYSGTTKSLGIALRDASGALNYTGDGTSGLFIWGAQLEAVTYQTTPSTYVATTTAAYYGPRFDYDPSTLAAKGLLIEGTRTNLVLQSSALTNAAWTAYQAAFTTDATLDPTGVAAQKLTATSGTTRQPQVYSTATVAITSGSQYTLSCYVKAGTLNYAAITIYGTTGHWVSAVFDLSTSATTTASQTAVGGTSGTLYSTFKQNVGNGWYRVGVVCAISQTAAGTIIQLAPAATGNTFAVASGSINFGTAAGTENIYISAPQLELGSFVTSYIPTVASSVARAAETFAITGYSSNLINTNYIDEQTGNTYQQPYNAGVAPSPSFAWLTALRVYTNAYAGNIATPSWLSFSRTGNAMVTDSTGKLTWAPANMITYSQDVTNAAWNKTFVTASTSGVAPDGTSTASLVAETTANNVHYTHTSNVVFSVGDVCLASVYFKKGNGATAPNIIQLLLTSAFPATNYANFNISSGTVTASSGLTANIVDAGNGWWRCSVYSTATLTLTSYGLLVAFVNDNATATRAPTYTGSTTSNVYIWGAQVERVTYETQPSAYIPTTTAAVYGPRYDFDASTVPATPRGLLIEESRSNLLTYSEQFDNAAWTKLNATISANATTAPDGTSTADKLVENTAASTSHYLYGVAASATSGTNYTYSVYAKAAERSWIYIIIRGVGAWSTPALIYYNLSTGTVGTVASGVTANIQNVGNGWYRLSATRAATATGNAEVGQGATTADNVVNYTGDGTSGIFIWGAQLEAGSFATSYVPTTSASVTRAADVAQLTGSALTTLSGTAASAITELNPYAISSGASRFVLSNAASNRLPLYKASNNTQIRAFNGTTTVDATLGGSATWATGGNIRAASGWDSSTISIVGSNGTVVNGAFGISGISDMTLGSAGGVNSLNGYVRSLAIYNQKLPDAILKQKSAVGAPY